MQYCSVFLPVCLKFSFHFWSDLGINSRYYFCLFNRGRYNGRYHFYIIVQQFESQPHLSSCCKVIGVLPIISILAFVCWANLGFLGLIIAVPTQLSSWKFFMIWERDRAEEENFPDGSDNSCLTFLRNQWAQHPRAR